MTVIVIVGDFAQSDTGRSCLKAVVCHCHYEYN